MGTNETNKNQKRGLATFQNENYAWLKMAAPKLSTK